MGRSPVVLWLALEIIRDERLNQWKLMKKGLLLYTLGNNERVGG